jgi:hypothetical protein
MRRFGRRGSPIAFGLFRPLPLEPRVGDRAKQTLDDRALLCPRGDRRTCSACQGEQ